MRLEFFSIIAVTDACWCPLLRAFRCCGLRFFASFFRPLAVVGGSLVLAYVVFVTVALSFGLDPDDKLVVHAVWARLRAVVPGAR